MKAYIKGTVFNADGTLQSDGEFKEAHSFVSNFILSLYAAFSATSVSMLSTANSILPNTGVNANPLKLVGTTAGDVTTGILIGSGTTAPTMADHFLTTQLLAVSAVHQIMSYAVNSPNASTIELLLYRSFLNVTGSALTINEVGIVVVNTTSSNLFMIDHTLYTVVVPAGGATTMTYKLTATL
jgi:hypothetical protein